MEYRKLGRSDIDVSLICLGTMTWGEQNTEADAHDQLSRALHWLLDETDVEYIIGGRATQRSEAQSQKEDFGGHDRESWHEFMRDYEEHGN